MKGYQSPAQFIRHTFPPRSDVLPPVIHAVCRQPRPLPTNGSVFCPYNGCFSRFVRASSGFFPLIPSLIPQLMCFCACGALVSGTQQVTENRYITDNPPENRMVDGDPLPENRPITRVSAVSAVLKEFPELSETLKGL